MIGSILLAGALAAAAWAIGRRAGRPGPAPVPVKVEERRDRPRR